MTHSSFESQAPPLHLKPMRDRLSSHNLEAQGRVDSLRDHTLARDT